METTKEINMLSKPTSIMKTIMSQPDLEPLSGSIDHDPVFDKDAAVALKTTSKRDIQEVSDPESASMLKMSTTEKLIKPRSVQVKTEQGDDNGMWPEQENHEQEKSGGDVPSQEVLEPRKPWPTCFSCREPHNTRAFPKLLPSGECTHGRETCRMCSIAWVRSEVQQGRMPTCALCKAQMSHEVVKSVTTKKHDQEVLKHYEKASDGIAKSKTPGFRWCCAPDCDSGQVDDRVRLGPSDVILTCDDCGKSSCIECRVLWHDGLTCDEFRNPDGRHREPTEHDIENALSESAIKKLTFRCPRSGCSVPIMRDERGGWKGTCDQMKCTRCELEICWRCGARYDSMKKNKGSAHASHCY